MSGLGSDASGWVLLATLLRPQGRKGEILAECFTDFPETLASREGLFLAPSEFNGAELDARSVSVTSAWLPKGRNEGRVVLAIGAVISIDQAEALSGLQLITRTVFFNDMECYDIYIMDIVGSTLFDQGNAIGVVCDLHFPTTPDGRRHLEDAAPLLVVGSGDEELLIPFVRDHIDRIDAAARQVHMHLPKGLIELQRASPAIAAHSDSRSKGTDEV